MSQTEGSRSCTDASRADSSGTFMGTAPDLSERLGACLPDLRGKMGIGDPGRCGWAFMCKLLAVVAAIRKAGLLLGRPLIDLGVPPGVVLGSC